MEVISRHGRKQSDKLWKTFIERAALPFWVPDEVADAEGSEVFAHVHEVSPEIVPSHSFCQIRLPIRWASAEEISTAACSEAVASIMMVRVTATWRLDASTFSLACRTSFRAAFGAPTL